MDDRPNLARRLRRIVQLALALAAVIIALALLPGRRVYSDANNCFGYALAGLGTTEHHHDDCTPSYTHLDTTELAGGWPCVGFAFAVAFLGAVVHYKPRRRYAWAWVVTTGLMTVLLILALFDFRLFVHVETLWPSTVLDFALGTLLVLVMIATPVVALVTREPSGSLPAARDRSGSR